MSDCNYCTWQRLKRRGYRKATSEERKRMWDSDVSKEDQGVATLCSGGFVYVDKNGKFAGWFMELPDHCCC